MNETDKAYMAGIMDADGYFTIKRSTYAMRVRGDATQPVFSERVGIKQVTPQAVEFLAQHFGGSVRIEKASAQNGKPLYSWQITNKMAARLVETLMPYLRIKRRQAEILLQLRESKDGKHRVGTGVILTVRSRWGGDMQTPQRIVDPAEIERREQMVDEVKSLNDCRYFPRK